LLLRFRFVLPVGGSSYAIEKVDFGRIYPLGTVEAVDLAALREKLAQLRCCNRRPARSGFMKSSPTAIG
jgi:hypothetical protein